MLKDSGSRVNHIPTFQSIEEIAASNLRNFWNDHEWRVCPNNKKGPNLAATSWADELFFCLLGGYGITFENNKIAFELLKECGYLDRKWFLSQEDCEAKIAHVLAGRPSFTNASFFYRFPNSKAKTICKAAQWLEDYLSWNFVQVSQSTSQCARQILLCCPGMGYKTSSWFLRNVGNGRGLAIIDVHIERVCKSWAIFPYGLSPQKDYLEMEQRLVRTCQNVNVQVEDIDLILWQFARGDFHTA